MHRRMLILLLVALLAGVSVQAQDDEQTRQPTRKWQPTKYEQFLSRKDAVIVSQSYIIKNEAPFWETSAKVAWELGQSEKIFALTINGQTADFDDLEEMLKAIDAMTNAINNEFGKIGASSMSYSSRTGLSIGYYLYADSSGKPQRNLYLAFKGAYFGQGPSLEPLTKLRTLIAEAREKLISVGARKAA